MKRKEEDVLFVAGKFQGIMAVYVGRDKVFCCCCESCIMSIKLAEKYSF